MRRQATTAPRHLAPAQHGPRGALAVGLLAVAAASVANIGVVRDAGALLPDLLDPVLPGAGAEPACAELRGSVGTVLVVGLPGVTEADDPLVDELADAGIGGVMLRDENLLDLDQAIALISGLRERLGPDLLVAVDEEGGRVTALRALGDRTPSARRLGVAGTAAARDAGAELGSLARSIGIDLVLAPVADVDDGPYDGVIGDRSFGGEPASVALAAGAFARGLRDSGVAATAKHFPGHGGSADPHQVEVVDVAGLEEIEAERMRPFERLIDQGIEAVMVGHVAYPMAFGSLPASLEPSVYERLRSTGFEGVALTDALGMGAIHARWGFDAAPALALAAGADAVLVTQGDRVAELVDGLRAALDEGRLLPDRFAQALARVRSLRGDASAATVCS